MRQLLLTPGPLTTTYSVKNAANYDLGSHQSKFIKIVNNIRANLLQIAKLNNTKYDSILMQGPGTMGIESVLGSTLLKKDKILILRNGAYGDRIRDICLKTGIDHISLDSEWNKPINPIDVKNILEKNSEITAVAVVHSETTTGLVNNIEKIGFIINKYNPNIIYIVDAMSSFGGIPIDFEKSKITYLISSANKCLQGIPGFSFIIADIDHLSGCENISKSLTLDLYAQWQQFKKNGEFRFTPPIQALLAFNHALWELREEGGVLKRYQRYIEMQELISKNMQDIGFRLYLDKNVQGPIITTFQNPIDFNFNKFNENLSEKGFVMYSGKIKQINTFRVGNIGNIMPTDINLLKSYIYSVLENMQYEIRY